MYLKEHNFSFWFAKFNVFKNFNVHIIINLFFRVHTGFEWNKYNQTHYDMDNPPPKIVQGYKFNIFYPDLIDKNTTPEYFLVSNFLSYKQSTYYYTNYLYTKQ